jgi:uncharacterized protein
MDFSGLNDFSVDGIFLYILMFTVAFLYASVGHGGASGYLAVLSFFGFSYMEMASTALMLNVLVAGLAFYSYYRGGYFSWRLTWPFMITSIPAAFAGGLMKLSPHTYSLLLAITLLFAAFRLGGLSAAGNTQNPESDAIASNAADIPLGVSLPIGAVVGLVSGMVGVGGGIFLSPLILLLKWADVRSTAAASALFIVVNAIAGLLARTFRQNIEVGNLLPLLVVCALGGWLGSYLGAHRFSSLGLRRLLALVLLIAAIKLLILNF